MIFVYTARLFIDQKPRSVSTTIVSLYLPHVRTRKIGQIITPIGYDYRGKTSFSKYWEEGDS